MTGNALPDDMARFVASGANEVLTKPLTKMKLLAAVERYLPSISVVIPSTEEVQAKSTMSWSVLPVDQGAVTTPMRANKTLTSAPPSNPGLDEETSHAIFQMPHLGTAHLDNISDIYFFFIHCFPTGSACWEEQLEQDFGSGLTDPTNEFHQVSRFLDFCGDKEDDDDDDDDEPIRSHQPQQQISILIVVIL